MRLKSTALLLCYLWKYLVSVVLFRLDSLHDTCECQSVQNKCLSPTRSIICIKMWKFGELRGVPERNEMEGWFSPLFYSVGEERRAGGQGVSFFHFHPTVEEKNREVGGRTQSLDDAAAGAAPEAALTGWEHWDRARFGWSSPTLIPFFPPPFGHQDRAAVSSWKYFPRSTNPRLGLGQLEKSVEILEVGATPSELWGNTLRTKIRSRAEFWWESCKIWTTRCAMWRFVDVPGYGRTARRANKRPVRINPDPDRVVWLRF